MSNPDSKATGFPFTTHGLSQTSTFRSWAGMIQRCTNPKHTNFKNWGGRGITFVPEWRSFGAFLKDMGLCPEGLSLERRRNHEGYSKDNCYWATDKQQSRNKRNNLWLTVGNETLLATEWAARLGGGRTLVYGRLDKGWSVERACTFPVVISKRKKKCVM